ncbi:MAG: hypothetical protein IKE58_06835 [Blautia sp.]|nr:hypothetical protein [Blautia sp.]
MSRLFGNMKWTLAMTLSAMMIVTSLSTVFAEDSTESPAEEMLEAVYLGVKDYGKEETNKENKENFLYRFGGDVEEIILRIDNGTKDEAGNYDYPIQNQLKEGYRYLVTIEDGTVTSVREIGETVPKYQPPVQGTEGERTVTNFLKTALMPVGTTLYIYGGGWDWQDMGSAVQASSFGVSPDWVRFFESQDEDFTYKEKDGDKTKADPQHSYYPYGKYNEYYYAGLDCSGFVGWVLYNTLETKEGEEGYVSGSTGMAKKLYECGLGEWTQDIKAPDGKNGYEMKPGDVMSINGHVWISLGTCDDGSVVIVHSTPSKSRSLQPGGGVQISAVGTDESCEAYILADRYMSEYFPAWYERYPIYLCDPDVYFTFEGENAGRFTWSTEGGEDGFTDPDGIRDMNPAQVLELLFE